MKSDHSDDRMKRVLPRFLTFALAIACAFFLSGRIKPARSALAHINRGSVSPALGVLFTVNSTADTPDSVVGNGLCANSVGKCTLRAAIQEANANSTDDTIEFNIPTSDPGYNGTSWTIKLSSALPILSSALTINGPGQNLLSIERDTSLATNFSIFNITNHPNFVTLSNLAIRFGASGSGGGINIFVNSNNGDAIRIDHCLIAGNAAIGGPGGGIYAGGSNLTITNTSIISNVAAKGGGIALADNPAGGGVLIASCDVSGNTAKGGNGTAGEGGGIYNEDQWDWEL